MATSSDARSPQQALNERPALLSIRDDALYYVSKRLDDTDFQHGLPWFDRECYPGPEKQGRRKKEQSVKQAIQMNDLRKDKVSDPRIHWLAAELFLNITNRLCRDDVIALGATCRELRKKIPPKSRNNQLRLLLRLHVERYKAMADRELSHNQFLASEVNVLCSLCLTLHRRKAFSRAELKKSPYDRVCRGAEEDKFQACEHETSSFMRLLRHFDGNAELEICVDRAHQFENNYLRPEYLRPKIKRRSQDDAGVLRYRKGYILSYDVKSHRRMGYFPRPFVFDLRLIRQMLTEDLVKLDAYICPHLRTSDPHIWRHELENPKELLHDEHALNDGWDANGLNNWARFAVCGEPDCRTRFGHVYATSFNWWPSFTYRHAMVFQVWRKFPVQNVRDERWLVQIDGS